MSLERMSPFAPESNPQPPQKMGGDYRRKLRDVKRVVHEVRPREMEEVLVEPPVGMSIEGERQPSVFISHLETVGPEVLERLRARRDELSTTVSRKIGAKVLNYKVMDGLVIQKHFPELLDKFRAVQTFAETLWGGPLEPLHDRASTNVNFCSPGCEQGFHYDRNEVTVVMYLTTSNGGDLEFEVTPQQLRREPAVAGKIVGLVGANRIRHRVMPVDKGEERIALVVGFAVPGKASVDDALRDAILFTNNKNIDDQKVSDI